ncbi:TIGR04197 family type VII secretion effector [Streptococcus didelphis]|uniref:TIGR04197 family type VII secretion effector n=1 Tax=Streptococcus didelphis TaxID=102886 RepID=A0ABY9LI58_9STRE|nr:TIGR04197 family type VII secretion effector [Streptococcus didelphis]WMB28582.1 TIGR04197 family type VII secretion effector [Streptococcus didelphis]
MAKIQSSIDEASNCASTISSAGADVMSVAQATKDETTTLSGNATAHSKIDLDDITAKQIANSINSFVGLIHGTANAFASTDSRLGQMIFLI